MESKNLVLSKKKEARKKRRRACWRLASTSGCHADLAATVEADLHFLKY